MMLAMCCCGSIAFLHSPPLPLPLSKLYYSLAVSASGSTRKYKSGYNCLLSLPVNGPHDLAALFHNKVLVAAGVSAAIGQLSKPFSGSILYGKPLDFFSAFQAGGFPSTHSSAVIATATSLALERGLSDSLVGLTIVYAGLVMYDAQGVRREVGNHAKALNQVLPLLTVKDSKDQSDSELVTPSVVTSDNLGSPLANGREPLAPNSTNAPQLSFNSNKKTTQIGQMLVSSTLTEPDSRERSAKIPKSSAPLKLKESIGHTEWEVAAGAFLGFLVALVVNTLI